MYTSLIKAVVSGLLTLAFISPIFIDIGYEQYDDSCDTQIIEPFYIIPPPRTPIIE